MHSQDLSGLPHCASLALEKQPCRLFDDGRPLDRRHTRRKREADGAKWDDTAQDQLLSFRGGPLAEANSEIEIAEQLADRSETLALVETSAGGLVSWRLTAVPGSSAWFSGGVVAYSSAARERWLGISPEASHGSVSVESALGLARAVRESLGTTWGAAETGIAGPQTGRRSAKPAGLAYVAVAGLPAGQVVEQVEEVATGLEGRDANRRAFAEALLDLILRVLRNEDMHRRE